MGLWALLLIRCSTITLLSDVGHITHTCTQQHSPSSVSPSIHHAPPSSGSSYLLCIVVAGFSANGPTLHCLYRRCCFLRKRVGCLGLTLRQTGALIPLLGYEGSSGGPTTSRLDQPHKQERRHPLTLNLKGMSLWVLLLIRCSAFSLLSDVGHITHTCTQQHTLVHGTPYSYI